MTITYKINKKLTESLLFTLSKFFFLYYIYSEVKKMFKGDRLKKLRINKCLNQQSLADMIGVSKSLISCYENGKRKPSLENIISFMEIFGVSSDYLLGADNLIKTISKNETKYKPLTNEEVLFIEELRKNNLVYEVLFTEPKRGAELIVKKLS